jgi:hypothetical protein
VNRLLEKYVAALIGFGFSAMWVVAGPASAFGCLLVAAAAYGVVAFGQKRRLDHFTDEFMRDASGRRRQRRDPRPSRVVERRRASA